MTYEHILGGVSTDLWIGGRWRAAADGARFEVVDPATEKKVTSVASATVEDFPGQVLAGDSDQ